MRIIPDDDAPPVDDAAVERAASEPALRQVLSACMGRTCSVKEISDATGIPLASVYRHVKALQEQGLLIVERSAISEDGKRTDLFRSRVRHLGMDVTPRGVSITWEVDEAVEDRIARMWRQLRL